MTICATSTAPRPKTSRRKMSFGEAGKILSDLPTSSLDSLDQIGEITSLVSTLMNALGVIYVFYDEHGQLTVDPRCYSPPHLSNLQSLLQRSLRLSSVAIAERSPQAGAGANDNEILIVAAPVFVTTERVEAVAIAVGVASREEANSTSTYVTQMLIWIAAYLARVRSQSGTHRQNASGPDRLLDAKSLVQHVCAQPSLKQSAQKMADWLRYESQVDIVAIGIRNATQRSCKLVGCSDTQQFDHRSPVAECLRDIAEETVLAASVAVDEVGATELTCTTSVDSLTSSGLELACRIPLRNASGDVFGAVLLLREASANPVDKVREPDNATIAFLGMSLALLVDAEPSPIRRLRNWSRQSRWYRHPFTWATVLAFAGLMILPVPLKVGCPCQIEPQQKRFVAVPYEGRLELAMTEPGELVQQGQLLAKMDGREIEFELAGLMADLQRAEKERDTALAAFETATAQMAELEARRLQLQVEELQERLHHLEIRSPIDGIVIGGDPRKMQGARMSMGQTILEVGPLDKMLVELKVDDQDIAHVFEGQLAKYRLSAMPWKSWTGTIQRIHPRSVNRDDNNVFIAEIDIHNTDGMLRPGMHGRAKIKTAAHPLAWNLFHKAWYNVRTWMAW